MTPITADTLADITLKLVQIPSVSGAERDVADCVHLMTPTWLPKSLHATANVHRIGNALIIVPARRRNCPTIGLIGHLDTVSPAKEQFIGIRDGRVFGCGASDMKSGVALMVAFLAHAADSPYNLCWVFYDREEGALADNGISALIAAQQLPAMDLALVLEPTDNQIHAGCMGSLQAEVTIAGKRAHSARPWQGTNALTRAAQFLTRLALERPHDVVCDGLTFTEVISATQAHTHNNRNVIPDAVTLNLNYRFSPQQTVATAERTARDIITTTAGNIAHTCTIFDASPAGAVHHTNPLLTAWIADQQLTVAPKQAWTDVAQLTGLGIPAINFGPGETAQAHQENESVAITNLERGYDLLKALLL